MAAADAPIAVREALTLTSIGICPQFINVANVTMESDAYICVRETSNIVIIDMSMPNQPSRRPITADSALMNPNLKMLALKTQVPGTNHDYLQILEESKSHLMPEQVVFWKWITPKLLGLVTQTAVYHWLIEGETEPVKMFERTANLANNQIINYQCDPSEKWLVLIGIACGAAEKPQLVKGNMQFFSVDQQCSQALEAHAAAFAQHKVPGKENPSTLISVATKTLNAGQITSKLHVIEPGAHPGKRTFNKKQADLFFPPDFADDFPVAMQISHKYSLIYVITKLGLLFVYDLDTATEVYRNRISHDPIILTCEALSVGGFYAINRRGQVFLVTVNKQTIVPFVSGQLNNLELAVNLAKRGNLPGAENLVVQRFQELFAQTKYKEAAELAAEFQGILRTPDTVAKFQSAPVQTGQRHPLLQYFDSLMARGKLNAFESLELTRLAVNENKKNIVTDLMAKDKLELSEELGDLVKTLDNEFALKIYIKAKANLKVVAEFTERRDFDYVLMYSKLAGYTPDYVSLLQTIMGTDPQCAVNFAIVMSQMEGGCPVDYNTITDLFLQGNMIREATAFLKHVLKKNRPEHGFLQTKLIEINLARFPQVANSILANGMFSHYDRPRVAQLCEKAGLYERALQHYTELPDIKRVIVNTRFIMPQSLVEFFGTLSRVWALECMKELLLVNLSGNLQIIVQVAKEYCERLGVEPCIKIFEQFKSYEGLYFFLETYLSSCEDPEIHFKYIESAAQTGQIKEVERVTKLSNFYDPEKAKNFLMEAKLPDAGPLINVCDRFGFVPDLTHYLYLNNMFSDIENYVQKVNPANAPLVVGQLLDDECPEDFIQGLILSVRSLLPVELLVEECEKRNRLRLLTQFLEHLVSEGEDLHIHNALVEFFGTLSREWALECMKELLLVNLRGNLQIIVQVAKKYCKRLGVEPCIKIFEQFKSYEGLYFFLETYLSSCEDPEIHFKYIESAAQTGQIKEVERVTKLSNFYDPEKAKNFLMEAKLPDAGPLINVCDRFGFVPDLTHYLYLNNMFSDIENYVQKVNPANAPLVVGQLLDDECPEDFIQGLILSVRSLLPVELLVEECEKRNRLRLLTQFLKHLVSEGEDLHIHNALGKIIIDSNNNPEHFLTTDLYYDSRVVGKYCEKCASTLAVVAYRRGQCDEELINVTNKNSLFKLQARYVVERMEGDLWEKVLNPGNEYRRQLIDQVVSTALPESKSPEQVSAAVKAFMTADLPHELIELLEKIVLQNSAFSGNFNLQKLLILTAIKADPSRVMDYVNMDYVNRLDNFEAQLFEEAYAIFKKLNLNVQAVNVLLDNIRSIKRAVEFAFHIEEDAVWSQVAKAQLRDGLVSDAVESFIRADDTQFLDVISAAEGADVYQDLVKYLLMVRQKAKEPKVDSELIYAYAKIDRLADIEEFIFMPNVANLQNVGDRLYEKTLYEAAKIIYAFVSNWAKLAVTLVKLKQFQGAVDAATKANSAKTWKEVCFACVDAEEFRLAQICGLNIIFEVDDLEEVSEYYQNRGSFNELISLMESGLGLERARMGLFTELGVLYARYRPEKLMEHIKLFSTRLNIPKLIRACDEQQQWKELTYLYIQYDEFDNAATTIMNHSPEAWDHMQFKDVAVKVADAELYYKAVHFYLQEHLDLINDLLNVLALRVRVYHTRVVDIIRKAGHLRLVKPYMVAVQSNNVSAVNEALNEIYIEEEDGNRLRESIDLHDNFDQIGLAQKIEKHELLEMRRVAAYIYKKAGRWKQSIALSKKDNLYKDAMETASQSGDLELAEELLVYFIEKGKKEYFTSCLFVCYDLIRRSSLPG